MDLSIIFVNWNSVDYLRDCLPSIHQYTRGISYEIIVVDNASPKGDGEVLEREFRDITLIRSAENLGFAGANNLGFRQSSGKYVLFLNPDTKLVSPAINLMLEQIESLPTAGIMGCRLLNTDLTLQTSCVMKFPTILNELFQSEYLRLRFPKLWGISPLFSKDLKPAEVEVITGACMLIRREVFESVGMFSEDYFMYAEDTDLCYKVQRAGWKNYFLGGATVVHYAGKSSAPEWQQVMKIKAMLKFCQKSRGHLYGAMFRVAMTVNAVLRILVINLVTPLRGLFGDKQPLQMASAKWTTILKTLLT